MTTLTLPWPPAVNNLFMNVGKRRIRTKRYDAWIGEAWASVLQQRPKPIHGPFNITIICARPDRRRRDLDGLTKAPLDLLVKTGVIEDDSLAQQLTIGWKAGDPSKPGGVLVIVESASPPALAVAA